MVIFYIILLFKDILSVRRLLLLTVLLLSLTAPLSVIAQISLSPQSYKTNLAEDQWGDWNDVTSWLVWNGSDWELPLNPPDQNSDVFILKGNEIRLTGNEEVHHLYLYSASDAGRKLNLQSHELHIYGALKCFDVVNGDYILRGTTSLQTDWIYPETGNLVFKGSSRTVVDRNSWSGNNINSRFKVIFDPDPGEELIVNSVFKSNGFHIKNGTVRQTVNYDGTAASSTFSFNTNSAFGTEDYGTMIIASGATLVSETSMNSGPIITRSNTNPASSFILEEGASLVLSGDQPTIDAMEVKLQGAVYYASESSGQYFVTHTMPNSQRINKYHHVYFQGDSEKTLPDTLIVTGNIQKISGGAIEASSSTLITVGNADQLMDIPGLTLENLVVDKSSGTLHVLEDLEVKQHLFQVAGDIDFAGKSLTINSSGVGIYSYISGMWSALGNFSYQNLPLTLDHSNASFPFFDRELMANMTLVVQGTITSPGQHLYIQYHENPGVNWDAGFEDNDESPILYHLNSYYNLSSTATNTDQIEIMIFSNDMIIDNESDLRMVAIGEAAAGNHLEASWINGNLWTKRTMGFHDLSHATLTIGSTGELTILPIEWLQLEVSEETGGIRIAWQTKGPEEGKFIIYRSLGSSSAFVPMGEVLPDESQNNFKFIDGKHPDKSPVYYQIKMYVDGKVLSESPIVRFMHKTTPLPPPMIFPNPYRSGGLNIQLRNWHEKEEKIIFQVCSLQGAILYTWRGMLKELQHTPLQYLKTLPPGKYIIWFQGESRTNAVKWMKE